MEDIALLADADALEVALRKFSRADRLVDGRTLVEIRPISRFRQVFETSRKRLVVFCSSWSHLLAKPREFPERDLGIFVPTRAHCQVMPLDIT